MAFKMRGFNPGKGTGLGSAFTKKTEDKTKKGEMPPEYVSAGMLDENYGTTARGDEPTPNKMRSQPKQRKAEERKEGSPMTKNSSTDKDTPGVGNTRAADETKKDTRADDDEKKTTNPLIEQAGTGAAEGVSERETISKDTPDIHRPGSKKDSEREGYGGADRYKEYEKGKNREIKTPPHRTTSPMTKNGDTDKEKEMIERMRKEPKRRGGIISDEESHRRDMERWKKEIEKRKQDKRDIFVPKDKGTKYGPIDRKDYRDYKPPKDHKSPLKKDKTHYKETDSDQTRGTIGGAHREKVGKEKPGGKTKEFKATTTRGGTEYTKTKGDKTKKISEKKFEQKQKQYGGKKNVEDRTKTRDTSRDKMMWEYGEK